MTWWAAALLAVSGCDGKDLGSGVPDSAATECNACHGNEDNAAPPKSLAGGESTADQAIGVHQKHLAGSKVSNGVACEECHVVPDSVDDKGHVDKSPADITWGALASADGAKPEYDPATGRCSNTYCHGATLTGGPSKKVVGWAEKCGSCHDAPPAKIGVADHPTEKDCSLCHGAWVSAEGDVSFEGSLHPLPGKCDFCHGNPPPAPHPQFTNCTTCHVDTANADGTINLEGGKHINGVIDGGGGIHPEGFVSPDQHGAQFNDNGLAGCTPCHGEDLKGGTSGRSCEQCHPGFTTQCTFCHGGTDSQDGAPPEAVDGGTATTLTGVGKHSAHLSGQGDWHKTIGCGECHVIPEDVFSPGHVDGSVAELTWGDLANMYGVAPEWKDGKCSSTYCHGGGTMTGGKNESPAWTSDGPTPATCDWCHGMPPDDPHPQATECWTCHSEVIGPGNVFGAPQKHMNGTSEHSKYHPEGWSAPAKHGKSTIEVTPQKCVTCHGGDLAGGISGVSCEQCHPGWSKNCTFCHGGANNDTGAPPADAAGNTDRSFKGVGAHTAHVQVTSPEGSDKAYGCKECHPTYKDALAEGHIDGEVAIKFGSLANKEEANPQWNGTSCSSVYCHGAKYEDAAVPSPVWTSTDGDASKCGACHGMPPSEDHPQIQDCSMCHGCVATADHKIRVEGAKFHVDGDTTFLGADAPDCQ